MYDTIKMHLNPLYFERTYLGAFFNYVDSETQTIIQTNTGELLKGKIKNIEIIASNRGVTVYGSLPKYLHGNNVGEFHRVEVEQSVNELSERLRLSLEHAKVSRIDIGANIEVTKPVEMYLPYLGVLPRWQRQEMTPRSLYYNSNENRDTRIIQFYDKVAELKKTDKTLFWEYAKKYLIRYELRYLQRVQTYFKQPVTGALLCDADFYNSIVDRWGQMFNQIKINRNMGNIVDFIGDTVKENILAEIGKVFLFGGYDKYMEALKAARKSEGGKLEESEYKYRRRKARIAFENKKIFADSELIAELTKKIADRVEKEKGQIC